MKKILVIEDDNATQYLCETVLRQEGYDVFVRNDCSTGKVAINQFNFDMLIFDLNLPDGDGLNLAGEVRNQNPFIPIFIMTVRNRPEERVSGFESGAMDYLAKPFHPDELVYRVRNILGYGRNSYKNHATQRIFGGWFLDLETRECCSNKGRRVNLTHGEFNLLAKLGQNPGRLVARDALQACITRGNSSEGHPRSVDVLASRLRRKFNTENDISLQIVAVPGVGYKLALANHPSAVPNER